LSGSHLAGGVVDNDRHSARGRRRRLSMRASSNAMIPPLFSRPWTTALDAAGALRRRAIRPVGPPCVSISANLNCLRPCPPRYDASSTPTIAAYPRGVPLRRGANPLTLNASSDYISSIVIAICTCRNDGRHHRRDQMASRLAITMTMSPNCGTRPSTAPDGEVWLHVRSGSTGARPDHLTWSAPQHEITTRLSGHAVLFFIEPGLMPRTGKTLTSGRSASPRQPLRAFPGLRLADDVLQRRHRPPCTVKEFRQPQ